MAGGARARRDDGPQGDRRADAAALPRAQDPGPCLLERLGELGVRAGAAHGLADDRRQSGDAGGCAVGGRGGQRRGRPLVDSCQLGVGGKVDDEGLPVSQERGPGREFGFGEEICRGRGSRSRSGNRSSSSGSSGSGERRRRGGKACRRRLERSQLRERREQGRRPVRRLHLGEAPAQVEGTVNHGVLVVQGVRVPELEG